MLEKNKNEFIEIYKENILLTPGSDKLLNYLISEQSDFFTAPCSTRFSWFICRRTGSAQY